MDFTQFAGLTRLAPSDPLSEDGFSFQNRNPEIIDHFLKLIVTHRHDAHAALADPATDPAATVNNVGGTIPADTEITVGYTLMDSDDGETLLNPVPPLVTTQAGMSDPSGMPVLALNAGAGALLANTYSYGVTVTDGAGGETALGPVATIDVPPSPNAEVTISGLESIVTDVGGAGWRLWRSVGGGDFALVGSSIDNSTDGVTDDGSLPCDCGVSPPSVTGTSRATSQLVVTVPGGQPAEAVQFRIYASLDGTFSDPCLLGTYPVAEAGTAKTYNALAFLAGSPPHVSTAVPGSTLIAGGGGGGGAALEPWPPLSARQGSGLQGDLLSKYAVTWNGEDGVAVYGRFYEQADPTYILGGRDTEVYGNAGANDYVPADWLGDTGEFSWDTTGVGVVDTTGATGADHVVYLPVANAGSELFGQVDYNIVADTWDHMFVGAWVGAPNNWGFVAVIDRVAGTLAIGQITSISPFAYVEIESVGAVDGYTVPVVGDTGLVNFRQVGNHIWVSDGRWPDLIVHANLGINDPITLNPAQGLFGGKWSAASAFNFDWIAFSEIPTAREVVAAPIVGAAVDETQAVRLWSAAETLQDVGVLDNAWANVVGRHNVAIRRYRGKLEIVGSASGGAAGTSLFTLPANDHDLWRPTNDTTVVAATDTGTTTITVHADGTVTSADAGPVHMNISIPLV